jgi:hypothetical protein
VRKPDGWNKGATHQDIPELEKVWWADLNFAPRSVWLVRKEGDFLRLPHGADPNVVSVEAGKRPNLVNGEKAEHLDISGLTFCFAHRCGK